MLVDSTLNNKLKIEGYVILRNALNVSMLDNIKTFYKDTFCKSGLQNYIDKNITHVNTAMSPNIEYKRSVFKFLNNNLTNFIESYFEEMHIVVCNFIVKYPGGENECRVHQDISLIEENNKESSYTVWFSLDDITNKTAPLYAIPKTHSIFKNYIRGIDVTLKLNNYKDFLIKNATVLSPLNKGDVIVMNPRTIHGSLPTPPTHETRIAIGLGIIPKSKNMCIYKRENDFIKKLHMNSESMLSYNPEEKNEILSKFELIDIKDIKKYDKFVKKLETKVL